MKSCGVCSETKDLLEFCKDRHSPDGRGYTCRLCARERMQTWRRANPERWAKMSRAATARWQKQNPERVLELSRRRTALLSGAPGGPFYRTRADYCARVEEFNGRCVYCAGPYEALDHAVPLSRGGTNHAWNIVPACMWCNRHKHAKTPAEFLIWLAKNKTGHGTGERGRVGRGTASGSSTGARSGSRRSRRGRSDPRSERGSGQVGDRDSRAGRGQFLEGETAAEDLQ